MASPALPSAARRPADIWGPVAIVILLSGMAFVMGLATTRGLEQPAIDGRAAGIDLYRDIAFAQTLLDTGYGPDPVYAGERSWYNPLVPAITALVSRITRRPVVEVETFVGVYANVLAPLAFFLLCTALLEAWTAALATAGFLFLMSSTLPSWMSATYSPWFLPVNFVQALFYLTLWAFLRGRRSAGLSWFAAVGVLWGFTFLGHTAPALLFGAIAIVLTVMDWSSADDRRAALSTGGLRLGAMGLAAMIVSSPLLTIVVWHYRLRIVHPGPAIYLDPLLARQLPQLVNAHMTLPMAVAVVGLASVWRGQVDVAARRLLWAWLAVTIAFLAYGYVVTATRVGLGLHLPSVVPSFHFFFYLKAASAILFGIGLGALGRTLAERLPPRWWPQLTPEQRSRRVAVTLCAALLVGGARTYASRPDFTRERDQALSVVGGDFTHASRWLRAHVTPNDVVLASDRDSTIVAGPSGARAVAASPGFSNPYVDRAPRVADRDAMLSAIERRDEATFATLAQKYGVTYAVLRQELRPAAEAMPAGLLEPVFQIGELAIFQVHASRR